MTTITSPRIASGTWTTDTLLSEAGFSVRHFGISWVRGGFTRFDITLHAEDDGTLRLDGSAPVEAITFPDQQLHGHLMSADFFDAELHPTITFESSEVMFDDDGGAHVLGSLTMRGTTRPVELKGSWAGPVEGMGGDLRLGLELTGVVDRLDYGISWAAKLVGGEDVVSPQVRIEGQFELVRQ